MGHISGKDVYRKLGKKVDGLTMRVPWNQVFYEILSKLHTPMEAELLLARVSVGRRMVLIGTGVLSRKVILSEAMPREESP